MTAADLPLRACPAPVATTGPLTTTATGQLTTTATGLAPHIALPGNRWDLLDGVVPPEPPSVSVIVVHYRQQQQLDRTLAALARQTHPGERLEVIVVDDGSPQAPSVPSGVRLLRQSDEGFRASAARNLGARHATGDVLCFLDADTSPEPAYVEELTRLPALAPDAVTVGTRRHSDLAGAGLVEPVELAGPAHALPAPSWLAREYERTSDLLRSDDRSYRFVIGAAVAVRRSFFELTGGFDETFSQYGGEDWEWAHRAWSHGAVFAHVPTAVAWHDGPSWAERGASQVENARAKNREALTLARMIAVRDARPRALRLGAAQVAVSIRSAVSVAALVVCVDQVLTGLPDALVVLPDARRCDFDDAAAHLRSVFGDDTRVVERGRREVDSGGAGVVVDLPVCLSAASNDLAAAVQRVIADNLGFLTLVDRSGDVLAEVSALRAVRRERRWGLTLFAHDRVLAHSAEPGAGEPDLEAYFGGWQ